MRFQRTHNINKSFDENVQVYDHTSKSTQINLSNYMTKKFTKNHALRNFQPLLL